MSEGVNGAAQPAGARPRFGCMWYLSVSEGRTCGEPPARGSMYCGAHEAASSAPGDGMPWILVKPSPREPGEPPEGHS